MKFNKAETKTVFPSAKRLATFDVDIFTLFIVFLTVISCNERSTQDHSVHQPTVAAVQNTTRQVMLSDNQIALANITTKRISLKPIGETIVINARLAKNQEESEIISLRIAGRIEKLFFKENGSFVQKGVPLYQLFSEELLTLQKEFLLAKAQFEKLGANEKRYKSFYDAARRKLLLYGMSEQEIQGLAASGKPGAAVTFLSPGSGVITEIRAVEGQYLDEGSVLMTIENISTLWVEAELYPHETKLARKGDKLRVKVTGFEQETNEATIEFLSPEFQANTQVMIMRATLNNPGLKYKPGMQAQVLFTHSTKKALTAPADAIIRDAGGAHLYVQRGKNTFRPQVVKTGLENFDEIEITEGIADGDTVVVTGAYLLYSEMVLRNGGDPMKMAENND